MKKLFILFVFIFSVTISNAQNVGIGTLTPVSSAALDVTSTSKGLLPPRMTKAQRDVISSPATGLIIFCTDCVPNGEPEFYNGTRWTSMNAAPLANVSICGQVWTNTNLNVSRYRNGEPIPEITNAAAWEALTTGAWCWYNNDSATYAATYGRLYNWFAVNDPRGLAPAGWHIPTDAEWTTLTDCLAGLSVAGGKMKETSTIRWISPNSGATNMSSFTGLPGGYREGTGLFDEVGYAGDWWSSTASSTTLAWARYLYYSTATAFRFYTTKSSGYSVRCVRD